MNSEHSSKQFWKTSRFDHPLRVNSENVQSALTCLY